MSGVTDLKPGDTINYTPIIDENFEIPIYGCNTILVDETESLTWKIWKIEEDNYIIVPDTPTSRYLSIGGGASGYNDLVQILNAYCRKYYSDAENGVYARSINMTDIENSMTEAGQIARSTTYNTDYNTIINPTTKTYYPGLYSLETSETIDQSSSPSSSIYAPWSGDTTKNDGETVYSDGYKVTTYFMAHDDIINNHYFDAVTENLLFTDNGKGSYGYWIATRSVNKATNLDEIQCASFGSRGISNDGTLNFFRMYYSDGTTYSGGSGAFKPVITIPKSKILKYIN